MSERNPSRRRRQPRLQDTQPVFELGRRMYSLSNHPLFDRNLMGDIMDYTDHFFQELFWKIHSGFRRYFNPDFSILMPHSVAANFCSIHRITDVYPAQHLRHFFPVFPHQLQTILEDIMRHFTEEPPIRLHQGRALTQTSQRLSRYNNFDPQLMNSIRGYLRPASTLRTVWNEQATITNLIFNEGWQNELVELYERLFQWLRTEGVQLNPRLNEYVAVLREIEEREQNVILDMMAEGLRRRGRLGENEEVERYVSPITDEEVSYMSGRGVEYLIYDILQMLKLFFEALTMISPSDLFIDNDD